MKVRSSSTNRALFTQKVNKCDKKPWFPVIKDVENLLQTPETIILMPEYDDTEIRRDLINRCEMVVYDIIEQLCAGGVPRISYRIPTVGTLAEQLESSHGTELSSSQSNAESSETYENLPSSVFDTPESLQFDCFDAADEDSQNLAADPRNIVDFARRRSRKKFALMMTVIGKIHDLLLKNQSQTRRSLFYELKSNADTVELINDQRNVDAAVRAVANLLECSPWDTRLVGTAKGLASGKLTLTLKDNNRIYYDVPCGALIPHDISDIDSIQFEAKRVIVVEKDTVFQQLLQEKCPSALNCILITGKGYPDIPTRMLVKHLAEKGGLPVYILVDADPYGMDIMFTYKYGSVALCRDQGSLACPSAQWVGIYPSELSAHRITKLSLTDGDHAKLDSLLSRSYIDEKFARELLIMRKGKAEIENFPGLTTIYLPLKIKFLETSDLL